MAYLKKICLAAAAVATVAFAGQTFADDTVQTLNFNAGNYDTAFHDAANDLVHYILNKPIKTVKNVTVSNLNYADASNTFSVTLSNPEELTHVEVDNLNFSASVLPIFGPTQNINVTLKLTGDVSATCQVTNGKYTIVKFTPANPILQSALQGDLTNDGDNMMNKLIESGLKAQYCH